VVCVSLVCRCRYSPRRSVMGMRTVPRRLARVACVAANAVALATRAPAGRLHAMYLPRRGVRDGAPAPAPDTVYALSSGQGRAALAIVRVTGPHALAALQAICASGVPPPPPRRAVLRHLYEPATREPLDVAMVLFLPGPRSFSGEDTVELHTHGSRAVVAGVLAALAGLPHLRPAEPGEFTRIAFRHGKLSLTQVEGLADLLNADTAVQRRQALAQLDGALAREYDAWRERVVAALAHVEALLDFGEDDVGGAQLDSVMQRVRSQMAELRTVMCRHLSDGRRGELIREGVSVAIVGEPNAGKSTLINALSRRDVSIVAPVAGTTRDLVEVRMDLGGMAVTIIDTAGIRGDPVDAVEREGIRRALQAAQQAPLRLVLVEASQWPDRVTPLVASLAGEPGSMLVLTKCDDGVPPAAAGRESGGFSRVTPEVERDAHCISCSTGFGLASLLAAVERRTKEICDVGGQAEAPLTRERHRHHLRDCAHHLQQFIVPVLGDYALDLAAEDLRLATNALAAITGHVSTDDVLDVVFRDFCIGK
jgi:tRNA modification GTPase